MLTPQHRDAMRVVPAATKKNNPKRNQRSG